MDLNDPTTVALLVAEALEGAGIPHALYGALLLAAYGEPRETRAADVAVVDLTAGEAQRILEALGLGTQLAFENLTFGGLEVSRITFLGSSRFAGLNTVDLVRPRSRRYAALALKRALKAPLRDKVVTLLTPEDFVLFKVVSTRERDLDDAASVFLRSGQYLEEKLIDDDVTLLAGELPDVPVQQRYADVRKRAGGAGGAVR